MPSSVNTRERERMDEDEELPVIKLGSGLEIAQTAAIMKSNGIEVEMAVVDCKSWFKSFHNSSKRRNQAGVLGPKGWSRQLRCEFGGAITPAATITAPSPVCLYTIRSGPFFAASYSSLDLLLHICSCASPLPLSPHP